MGFSAENGYVPLNIDDIMNSIMNKINELFETSYTPETFEGTGYYKYAYAIAQRILANEVKTSEIFLKLQDYFLFTNETILNPKVTPPGILQAMAQAGYTCSMKPMIEDDAGKAHICVDVDDSAPDYAETRLAICELIKDYISAGVVTVGTESETLTLSNGQSFDFKFNLPTRLEPLLKLTVKLSRNNQSAIESPEFQKQRLMDNISSMYALGKDFEPERYFTVADAPWAGDITLEYSLDDGETWDDETYEATYDEIFDILLENITVVEA